MNKAKRKSIIRELDREDERIFEEISMAGRTDEMAMADPGYTKVQATDRFGNSVEWREQVTMEMDNRQRENRIEALRAASRIMDGIASNPVNHMRPDSKGELCDDVLEIAER